MTKNMPEPWTVQAARDATRGTRTVNQPEKSMSKKKCYCGANPQTGLAFCNRYPLCVKKRPSARRVHLKPPTTQVSDFEPLPAHVLPAVPVSDDRDDARQAMQIIISSVENIGRMTAMKLGVADDIARVGHAVSRLDNATRRIEATSAAAELSLQNVRMLAMRLRRTDPENAAHFLRFCESAGVVGSVTRGA